MLLSSPFCVGSHLPSPSLFEECPPLRSPPSQEVQLGWPRAFKKLFQLSPSSLSLWITHPSTTPSLVAASLGHQDRLQVLSPVVATACTGFGAHHIVLASLGWTHWSFVTSLSIPLKAEPMSLWLSYVFAGLCVSSFLPAT